VHAGNNYRKIWPPPDWPAPDSTLESGFRNHERSDFAWLTNFQITAAFADLNGNGSAELIVLQDQLREEPAQSLAVYRLANHSFHLVSRARLPSESIAFVLSGIRDFGGAKEIVVRTATSARCDSGGAPYINGTAEVAYNLRNGRLVPVARKQY
jgi:hypothetical protein